MGFFKFLTNKKFYLHVLVAIVVTVILYWLVFGLLRIYTDHGEFLIVPDFYGSTLEEIKDKDLEDQFRFVVIDSVYDPHSEKGIIIQQDPLPYSRVKQNRKIYVTIVAKMPEQILMPDLVDLTLRQALVVLQSAGLSVDVLTYMPHFAENAVLEQHYLGHPITRDTLIDKGSRIELVIGDGYKRNNVAVPLLIGEKQSRVKKLAHLSSLNIRHEYFLDGRDTLHARVYRQEPSWDADTMLTHGNPIDVWYRSDELFDFGEYLLSLFPDTTRSDTLTLNKIPE